MKTTTSTIQTAFVCTSAQLETIIDAGISAALVVAPPAEAIKYTRLEGMLCQYLDAEGESVQIPMNLRKLALVRRTVKYAIASTTSKGNMALANELGEVYQRTDALVMKLAHENGITSITT